MNAPEQQEELAEVLTLADFRTIKEDAFEARVERMAAENTAGACHRGCCWNPWSTSGVCSKRRACGCHHRPQDDPRYIWAAQDTRPRVFTTMTSDGARKAA